MRDALGNIRTIIDGSGNITESRLYSPYGEPYGGTGSAQTTYGFTGEPTDSTGFVHLRARYYNPSLGQFMNLDPKETPNRFAYVDGNPVNRTDPSGLYFAESATTNYRRRRRRKPKHTPPALTPAQRAAIGGGGRYSGGAGGSETDELAQMRRRQEQLEYQRRLQQNNSTEQASTNQTGYIGGGYSGGGYSPGMGNGYNPKRWGPMGYPMNVGGYQMQEGGGGVAGPNWDVPGAVGNVYLNGTLTYVPGNSEATGRVWFGMKNGYTLVSVDAAYFYSTVSDPTGFYKGNFTPFPREPNAYPFTGGPLIYIRTGESNQFRSIDIHLTGIATVKWGDQVRTCAFTSNFQPGGDLQPGQVRSTVVTDPGAVQTENGVGIEGFLGMCVEDEETRKAMLEGMPATVATAEAQATVQAVRSLALESQAAGATEAQAEDVKWWNQTRQWVGLEFATILNNAIPLPEANSNLELLAYSVQPNIQPITAVNSYAYYQSLEMAAWEQMAGSMETATVSRYLSGFGGLGSFACFSGGTPVWLDDQTTKPIDQIRVGDKVLARDEKTGIIAPQEVTRVWEHDVSSITALHLDNDERIETTQEHRFAVSGKGFVSVHDFASDDKLITHSDDQVSILKSEIFQAPSVVYNLTVKNFHTYFVGKNGLWVHNDKGMMGW